MIATKVAKYIMGNADLIKTKVQELIQAFADLEGLLLGYQDRQVERVTRVTAERQALAKGAVVESEQIESSKQSEITSELVNVFHLYMGMWRQRNMVFMALRHEDAAVAEEVSTELAPVTKAVTDTAQAVHHWLNEEVLALLQCTDNECAEGYRKEIKRKFQERAQAE